MSSRFLFQFSNYEFLPKSLPTADSQLNKSEAASLSSEAVRRAAKSVHTPGHEIGLLRQLYEAVGPAFMDDRFPGWNFERRMLGLKVAREKTEFCRAAERSNSAIVVVASFSP